MSFCVSDLLLSGSYAFSTFLGPASEAGDFQFGSTFIGTQATCRAQASIAQLGLSQPSYNAALSIYYVMMVRFNKTDRSISKWFLPLVHGFVISYNVSGVVLGNVLDAFNPAGALGCSFADPCHGLQAHEMSETCMRMEEMARTGHHTHTHSSSTFERLIFTFIVGPVVLNFVIIAGCMFTIYWTIKKVEDKAKKWSFEKSIQEFSTCSSLEMSVGHLPPIKEEDSPPPPSKSSFRDEVSGSGTNASPGTSNPPITEIVPTDSGKLCSENFEDLSYATHDEIIVDIELDVATGDEPPKPLTRSTRRQERDSNAAKKPTKSKSEGARDIGLLYGMPSPLLFVAAYIYLCSNFTNLSSCSLLFASFVPFSLRLSHHICTAGSEVSRLLDQFCFFFDCNLYAAPRIL